jgi:hypothetical protein
MLVRVFVVQVGMKMAATGEVTGGLRTSMAYNSWNYNAVSPTIPDGPISAIAMCNADSASGIIHSFSFVRVELTSGGLTSTVIAFCR